MAIIAQQVKGKIMRCLFFITGLLFTYGHLFAATPKPVVLTCPAPETLVKDSKTLLWSANEAHWQTHTMSFADEITTFLGAQWNGASLGNVYCLYQGKPTTFIVQMEFDALVYPPSGDKWSSDLEQVKNCISSDPAECPFQPKVKKQTKSLYEELDDLTLKQGEGT